MAEGGHNDIHFTGRQLNGGRISTPEGESVGDDSQQTDGDGSGRAYDLGGIRGI